MFCQLRLGAIVCEVENPAIARTEPAWVLGQYASDGRGETIVD